MEHYFIAVSLDETTKAWLAEKQQQLYPYVSYKNWVNQQDFHLTLYFFGGIAKEKLEQISKQLETIKMSPFILEISGLGYFGLPERPRVIWAKTVPNPTLDALQQSVQQVIGDHLPVKPNVFVPHITLAKKWADEHVSCKKQLWDMVTDTRQVEINQMVIYQIHPNKQPKYYPWKVFKWE